MSIAQPFSHYHGTSARERIISAQIARLESSARICRPAKRDKREVGR